MSGPITGRLDGPQYLPEDCSSLATAGHSPLIITGALVWILRNHFATADSIVDPALKRLVWTPQTESTGISIESITQWHGQPEQRLMARPAVWVKRNSTSPKTLGIGHSIQKGGYPVVNSGTGMEYGVDEDEDFAIMVAGSHTVFCLGGKPAEAEALATEVFYELLEFSPVIIRDLNFSRLQVMELGGLARLEESKEHWAVPIVLAWSFQHRWTVRRKAPPLKSVGFET